MSRASSLRSALRGREVFSRANGIAKMKTGLGLVVAGVFVLAGCGNAPADSGSEETSSLQLNLTTTAASGTVYRLGPATRPARLAA